MPGVTVKVIIQDIKKLATEALIVGFHEDVRPLKGFAGELDWLLCGALSSLVLAKKLSGSLGDVALVTSQGKVPAQKIFLVGLGSRAGSTLATLKSAARFAAPLSISPLRMCRWTPGLPPCIRG
jgi:Cytosol aminopeptidase family, N-terminal domain